ncbi:NADP-dependent oxidoreductase [Tomitella biformata]|uniref:NADP-dependent oxidoreductase n=1 Tax=Tomitella biformata TaxID=630403 RepID=UPI0004669D30|nr:NADP-dependent oxidoreductase [Tomitella biformata]
MRAVQYSRFGDPEVLGVAEANQPHAGVGQVRILVRAAGVNLFDCKERSGMFGGEDFPRTPGLEASGIVDEVGDGVTEFAIGDAVFGLGSATNAEFAVLDHYAHKPDALSWPAAAGVATTAEAALRSLELLGLAAGQTLLIDGAAGGVGHAAAQFAIADGLTVIGTARESKHDALRALGAHPTTYGPGLAGRVDRPVDGALDTAGHGSIRELAELTGDPGRVVTIADFSGAVPGVQLTTTPSAFHALDQASRLAEAGRYSVDVDSAYPLESAAAAHARCEAGRLSGKVVFVVSA